jgi:diguanylate cyclase (GGDEF)-like protein
MIDNLSGLPDIAGMLEWIDGMKEQALSLPFSLMAIHLTALRQANHSKGRPSGDALLKWCVKKLKDNHPDPIFRVCGDKFVVILNNADFSRNMLKAQQLAEIINPGNINPGFPSPHIAVIHFSEKEEFNPGNVLACLFVTLSDRCHQTSTGQPVEFNAACVKIKDGYLGTMIELAEQIRHLAKMADTSFMLSQTDNISQLPNIRAAMCECETALADAQEKVEPLSILMIDGDNLRQYNKVSYAAGDEAIRQIGVVLRQEIREKDFLARYRSGDEFLVIMRNINKEHAKQIAQRLCLAVEGTSRTWLFPITISIGVSTYPEHGRSMQELLHAAEEGLKAAKRNGKNQVSVSDPQCEINQTLAAGVLCDGETQLMSLP